MQIFRGKLCNSFGWGAGRLLRAGGKWGHEIKLYFSYTHLNSTATYLKGIKICESIGDKLSS